MPPANPRPYLWLLLLAVALGFTCRLAQYLSQRSFWQDEAYVILNLRAKSPSQLMGPLDARPGDPQAAPPAFLLLEKALFTRSGPSELALRFPAQLLGLLALPLLAIAAWRLLPPPGAAFAVALLALSDRIIAHAAEVKQYSGDVFSTCLLLYLATRATPARPLARLFLVNVAAAALVWISYTTLFVAASVSLAILLTTPPRTPRAVAGFLLAHLPLACSTATVYLLCARHQQDPNLYAQWAEYMPDWRHPLAWPRWLAEQTYHLANYAALNTGPILLVLALAGCISLRRTRDRHTLVLLLAPTLLCLLAAFAHAYPFGGARTSAFLAPTLCLLAGAGFAALLAMGHRALRTTGAVLAAIAIAILAVDAARGLITPRTRSHLRPALAYLREHRQPTDTICVIGGAASDIYRVYQDPIDDRTHLNVQPDQPLPQGRFWLIAAGSPDRLKDAVKPYLERAHTSARLIASSTPRGGAAYLFESKR